eukprot:scaffold278537_cov31-Tisochrysis_lutea.AAC.4
MTEEDHGRSIRKKAVERTLTLGLAVDYEPRGSMGFHFKRQRRVGLLLFEAVPISGGYYGCVPVFLGSLEVAT